MLTIGCFTAWKKPIGRGRRGDFRRGDDRRSIEARVVELETRLVARQIGDAVGLDRHPRRIGGDGIEADAALARRGDDEERRLARVLHEGRRAAQRDAGAAALGTHRDVAELP